MPHDPIPAAAVEAGEVALRSSSGLSPYYAAQSIIAAALPYLAAPATDDPPLTFAYRNYRGEIGQRVVRPIKVYHGATEWHPEPQWLLYAYDLAKCETRAFAMRDMVFGEHLAAPAGDVAPLVARFRAGAACHPPCKVMDARSGCICAEAADGLSAIAAERDEHKRTAERLDVKLFAFTGRAIKAEAERDALAERLRVAEEALKPFARHGDYIDENFADHDDNNVCAGLPEAPIRMGDFRRARALTQASAPETGERDGFATVPGTDRFAP